MNKPRTLSRNSQRSRRGIVLMIVLIVLLVLTFSAYTFTDLMRTHNVASDLTGQQVQARLLAESGVEAVRLFLMQTPATQSEVGGHYYNTLYFQARNVIPDVDLERVGNFTVLAPLVDEMGNLAAVRYGLEDESNRLNV
ncbi:MAG: type II secretion system protein GspK, partial [Pirellulaceae bacterium]